MRCVAAGHKFVFTLCLKEKHSSGIQILKYTHRRTNASAAACYMAALLSGAERIPVEEFQGAETCLVYN